MRGWIRTVLVAGVLVVFSGSLFGLWSFKVIGYERLSGQATYDINGVVGPETGSTCPTDKRYVDEQPTGLRDDVLAAFQQLKTEAKKQNITMCLQDGKRSSRQQQAQFDDYVKRFGTRELARKYALPPDESMHVKGIAVDIQPLAAAGWVERSAGKHGWCRRYENEPWHFEYNPDYRNGCPALLPHA
ncbi:D-alanyl-D-alanine carboxypeptidase family protein [Actinosynnema sp. ALI-1.44]|uniref:D-alanyl-D-alanine carboxypeptidase family protein n=1 Tax=Actinosynnema sp. ALI-1.44 TaxID=1933779 RepID=UPI001178C08E|nr:D-alanyl-D-alanine carboxypeptidase family protein [Actinosynnema sp. ALI-1.44]